MVTFVPPLPVAGSLALGERARGRGSAAEVALSARARRAVEAGPRSAGTRPIRKPVADGRPTSPTISTIRRASPATTMSASAAISTASTSPSTGLDGVEAYPLLFAELIRRGWSDANLAKLAGGNVLRAMRGAEATAAAMKTCRRRWHAAMTRPTTSADPALASRGVFRHGCPMTRCPRRPARRHRRSRRCRRGRQARRADRRRRARGPRRARRRRRAPTWNCAAPASPAGTPPTARC